MPIHSRALSTLGHNKVGWGVGQCDFHLRPSTFYTAHHSSHFANKEIITDLVSENTLYLLLTILTQFEMLLSSLRYLYLCTMSTSRGEFQSGAELNNLLQAPYFEVTSQNCTTPTPPSPLPIQRVVEGSKP